MHYPPEQRRNFSPAGLAITPHNVLLIFLTAAIFCALAGNIPLTGDEGGDKQSALTAVVRGAGLIAGMAVLVPPLMGHGVGRLESLTTWLIPFAILLAYCVLSAAWSLEPSATLIRSAETAFTIVFAALWTHLAGHLPNSARKMCSAIAIAAFVVAIYGLAVNTIFYGSPFRFVVNYEESERARFVFGGIHPLGAGDILAIGAIATVLSDLRWLLKFTVLPPLLVLLYLTDATGARLLVAAIYMFYAGMRIKDVIGWARVLVLAPIFIAIAAIAVAIVFSLELSFTHKVADDDRLWTLTGRTELWSAIWQSGLANTWFGTGFDAARGAILDIFGIAYQVHNQYLAILVELGYIGSMIFVSVFAVWLIAIARSQNVILYCFTIYILGINMDNASMLSKTWLIFLSILCYVFAQERRAEQVSAQPDWTGAEFLMATR